MLGRPRKQGFCKVLRSKWYIHKFLPLRACCHSHHDITGFSPRSNTQHREYQARYQECTTKNSQKDFVKEYATRWCQLTRLPYFDLCRMIVIDPMHNLFLGEPFHIATRMVIDLRNEGLVKTHFYHIWIQHKILRTKKELRRLHAILSEVRMCYR
jgi:hypothetical protein